jgi:hypothetical protein
MSNRYDRELASGLLKREETPPSLQAPKLAIINWRQLAPEQKRYPTTQTQ